MSHIDPATYYDYNAVTGSAVAVPPPLPNQDPWTVEGGLVRLTLPVRGDYLQAYLFPTSVS